MENPQEPIEQVETFKDRKKRERREYMRQYMRARRESETGQKSYTRGPYKPK